MERISTIGQKSPSWIVMAGRVNLFGSTLQIYQSMSRIETRLAGSSFNRRLGKASFFSHWNYTEKKKWRPNPLPKQVVSACFGWKTMNSTIQKDIISFFLNNETGCFI